MKNVIRNLALYGGLVIFSWAVIIGGIAGLRWLFITVWGVI